MKKHDFDKHLKSHGCRLLRQGEHEYWCSADGTRTAGVPRHKELKTPTTRSICKDLGIPAPAQR